MRPSVLLLSLAPCCRAFDGADIESPRWSLLKVFEKSLSATAGMVRGVGDGIAIGTGTTIRIVGGSMQQIGVGIDGLGEAVEGDVSQDKVSDSLRTVASRPIRVVGRVVRALGDTTNFIGDTTEKVASEAMGMVPDTVRVVETLVRTIREKIGDVIDDESGETSAAQPAANSRSLEEGGGGEGAAGARDVGAVQQQPGSGARVSIFGEDAASLSSSADRTSSSSSSSSGSGSSGSSSSGSGSSRDGGGGSGSSRGGGGGSGSTLDGRRAAIGARHSAMRARLGSALGSAMGGETPQYSVQSHTLLALATVALSARSSLPRVGLVCVLVLALLHLGHVNEVARAAVARDAATSERLAACLDPRVSLQALVAEPVGWLNALLASGWGAALGRYTAEVAREALEGTLATLTLPKTFRSVKLIELNLGTRPPLLRSVACVACAGPPPAPRDGCALQAELEWEAPQASATLAFQLANVASQPRLRLRRARLRGTVRLHWEWVPDYPYIGRLRATFASPPEVTNLSIEPLGTVDVTALPGIGAWLRESLRVSIETQLCLPSWVQTDVRVSAAAVEKLKSAQIIRAFLAEQRAEAAAAAAAAGAGDAAAGATSTSTRAATAAAATTGAQAAAVHDSPIVPRKASEDGGLRMSSTISSTPALTKQGQPAVTPQEALFSPLPPSPQWRPEHEDSEDYGWAYR